MAETMIEKRCREARDRIRQAVNQLHEAAWEARESDNPELDKAVTAVGATLEGVQLLLISLPRLKS